MTSEIKFRSAKESDLSAIIHMLADDHLGTARESIETFPGDSYHQAFNAIDKDPNHELIVAELNGEIIGTLHLMFLPSISFKGGLRSQVESVRVKQNYQSQGIGSKMMHYAIERAKARGAHLMQLTTHESRTDAHRFYERLGFKASHLGMKFPLK